MPGSFRSLIPFVGLWTFALIGAAAVYYALCGVWSVLGPIVFRRLWATLGLACIAAANLR